MSKKPQATKNPEYVRIDLKTTLMVVAAALMAGIVWYVWQAQNSTEKTLNQAQSVQTNVPPKHDPHKDWKTYAWTDQNISFKYPSDWFVRVSGDRVYVRNVDVDLTKEATPDNFQQIWFSADPSESSSDRQVSTNKGESTYRVISGPVSPSTIKAGSLAIQAYQYETTGGPTLEAYITTKTGHRLFATTSTEVGQQNQKDMVANLKQILTTVTQQ